MKKLQRTCLVAAACAAAASFSASVSRGDIVTDWNQEILNAIRRHGDFELASPGVTSRYSAIVFVSMYDAINSITRTHEPCIGFGSAPPGTSKEAALTSAAHTALMQLFPDDAAYFDARYAQHLAAIPDGRSKSQGIALGTSCAKLCIAARDNDGSTDYVSYVSGSNPGDWQPTFPDYTGAWGPHWGSVKPWCMTSPTQFRPATGPYGYNDMASLLASPEWAADYNEVLLDGAMFSSTRTPDQTLAALYWANDRNGTFKPPGHLLHITERIAEAQGNTLEENARLFALVTLGMADAGIASWDTKYNTDIDLWRPITAIWAGDTDGNPATIADPTWFGYSYDVSVLVFTPPFPAWVSGHATFGAVHAAVVRNFYGTDAITFSATSDDTPGYWRTFTSLDAAARENGLSRIWLGVHWRADAEGGYEIGTNVGNYISANFLRRLGDLNGDGIVGPADLAELLGAWGTRGGEADIDRDGLVGAADLALLLGAWG